jgi:RNA polymerase primary sigma factor
MAPPRSGPSSKRESGDSLQTYMTEIASSQPLSGAKEKELALRVRKGDALAKHELVEANLRFVITVARPYQHRGLPLDDLISAGNLGLVIAADRFDPDKGYKFITYAVWWIRQSICWAVSQQTRTIRLPANRICMLGKIADYTTLYEHEHGSSPSGEETARAMNISDSFLTDTLASAKRPLSLDKPVFADGDDRSGFVADTNQESPDTVLMQNSLKQQIGVALDRLADRERTVLKMYFGLNDGERMTLNEIGNQFGICRERVRQIKAGALVKLRKWTRSRELLLYLGDA